ncbi:MAG: hypothetical protein ACTSQO_10545 [Candidatus Helarchaeota archaeon]
MISISNNLNLYNDEDCWESGVSDDLGKIFINYLMKLPKYWYTKFYSNMILKTLPEFPLRLDIPDSSIIFSWIKEICSTDHRQSGTPEGLKTEN